MDIQAQNQTLRAYVSFLLSCVRSGEKLSAEEEAEIRSFLNTTRPVEYADLPKTEFPILSTMGNGEPDWCSVHGDIPRNVSIASHIESTHGMTYKEWSRVIKGREKEFGIPREEMALQAKNGRVLW